MVPASLNVLMNNLSTIVSLELPSHVMVADLERCEAEKMQQLKDGPLRALAFRERHRYASPAPGALRFAFQFNKLTCLLLEPPKSGSFSDSEIEAIVVSCPQLVKLGLGCADLFISSLQILERLPKLTHLGFEWIVSISLITQDTTVPQLMTIIEQIVGAMPSRIGVNFFVAKPYGVYEPFLKTIRNHADDQVAESIETLGGDLRLELLDRSGTVLDLFVDRMKHDSQHKLLMRFVKANKCDPGQLFEPEQQSLFIYAAQCCKNLQLSDMEHIFTTQLERALKMHPENPQLFLRDQRGVSVVMHALLASETPCGQYIISQAQRLGLSTEDRDYRGNNAAHLVCAGSWKFYASALKDLREHHKVDLNAKNDYSQKPVHLLSIIDNLSACLEAGAVIDAQDLRVPHRDGVSGRPLLTNACRLADLAIVKRWIEEVATSESIVIQQGYGPLHAAVSTESSERAETVTQLLLNHRERLNIDVNAAFTAEPFGHRIPSSAAVVGSTPLHLAVAYLHERTTELLLHAGARVDLCTCLGMTPLHLAAERGSSRLLNILITQTQDKYALSLALLHRDRQGHTPLMSILQKLGMKRFEESNIMPCVTQLIEAAGMNQVKLVNLRDSRGNSPLFYCQRRKADALCKYLKIHGATIEGME